MPILTLKFNGQKVKDYQLENGYSLTIGRRKDNDVVVDNLAVSGHHAKIDSVDNGFLLLDLKSLNGTFVNERRVDSVWLNHGDTITIGKHSLILAYRPGESRPDHLPVKIEATMVIDTKKHREMLRDKASGLSQQNEKSIPIISFLAGREGEVTLSKKLIKIGKDPVSDIVVRGFMVGKTAATISKRNNGFYLSYAEGISKPLVNAKKVKESVQLKEFDIIQIGSVKMQLVYKDPS